MTPETTALVQWVRERAERAEDTVAYYPGWSDEEAKRLREIEVLLSQERTCSTCQHLAWACVENYAGRVPTCGHDHSAALDLAHEAIKSWGCLLWEQAEIKEVDRG